MGGVNLMVLRGIQGGGVRGLETLKFVLLGKGSTGRSDTLEPWLRS